MATKKESSNETLNKEKKIKVSKNGSYIVSGGIPLVKQTIISNAEGIAYEWRADSLPELEALTEEDYDLCRCGRSYNKPFCDGTHLLVNFDGTETASREDYLDQAEKTIGPALTLTDVLKFGANARFCDLAGGTWELTRQSGDPEAKRMAIEEAGNCPAGRLVVWDTEGNAIEPEFEPSIGLVEDPCVGVSGPLWVRGYIPIESADGTTYEIRNRVTLCRCGKSSNKPFCDGSHENE
jgi:CDGSH-type Zn-finger protein